MHELSELNYSWHSLWPAPAKINIFLHVLGRRPDGYHFVQTALQFISLQDELRFEPRSDGKIFSSYKIPNLNSDFDLVMRAARLLQPYAAKSTGVTISLCKNIPIGGGLGGGSSDAATVLLALNYLWECGLTRSQLATLGLSLGVDVPFFIEGYNAFAEGVGEKLMPMSFIESNVWYVILVPSVLVSTPIVFANLSADCFQSAQSPDQLKSRIENTCNSLEAVACRLFPEVDCAVHYFKRHGVVRMSGSGACLFLSCMNQHQAECIALECQRDGWEARAVSSLSAHPLLEL